MNDEGSALTKDAVREEAREILFELQAGGAHQASLEDNWRKLWQLLREARAASLATESAGGPWHVDYHFKPFTLHLAAGNFGVPIWPPEDGRSARSLAELLNWAGVPTPDAE